MCPQCGRRIAVDSRFVKWCEHCNWNLDASKPEPKSRRQLRREEAARRKGVDLFEELKNRQPTKPGVSQARVAAFALALAIHAFTLAVFLSSALVLITNFGTFFGFVVGGFLILFAVLIHPRFGGVKAGTVILPREAAPSLYGLADRVAVELGGKPIDLITLDGRYNAGYGQLGLRRRRVLTIGLPLWNVLDDQQRIALLGHELAHQVNGDLAEITVVSAALRTLDAWYRALSPGPWQPGSGSIFAFFETIGQLLARGIYRVLRLIVEIIFRLEESLLFASGRRAEYYADRLAARIASSEATIAMLDTFYLDRPCLLTLRFASRRDEGDVWAAERTFLAEISPKEWERLRRLDAIRGAGIDDTHPPTNLRIELLRAQPPESARIQLTNSESTAIAAEMASGYSLVGERIAARFGS